MKSIDPNVLIDIFVELKGVFVNGGVKKKKYTLPPLANALIGFCFQVGSTYDAKHDLIDLSREKDLHVDEIL